MPTRLMLSIAYAAAVFALLTMTMHKDRQITELKAKLETCQHNKYVYQRMLGITLTKATQSQGR
jgi:hypothetical protein